jgi:hypothetical protein
MRPEPVVALLYVAAARVLAPAGLVRAKFPELEYCVELAHGGVAFTRAIDELCLRLLLRAQRGFIFRLTG